MRSGVPIAAFLDKRIRACFDAGDSPKEARAKVPEVSVSTIYDRYRVFRGGPRHRKQRLRGQPPRYTGPDWIGKAITKP